MKESTPILNQIVQALDREVKNQLEMASVIGHPGERAVERVRTLLRISYDASSLSLLQ